MGTGYDASMQEQLPLEPAAAPVPRPSELAARVRDALAALGPGWVEGEVRGLQVARSGHAYFDLTDGEASFRCTVWRGTWQRLEERPAEGMLVQARYSRVDFYAPRGTLGLVVEEVRPTGEGELLRRVRETLARLVADGLCDPARRTPVPRFPRRVGVVAGRDSDALHDVGVAIRRRFPPVRFALKTAVVQGVQCVPSVTAAIARLAVEPDVDVIVLARGGGSVQDLYPFSDEALCRAIAASPVPVVTSIGHTRQRPNCDFVAAACADVPARAAELVVPSAAELAAQLTRLGAAMESRASGRTRELGLRLDARAGAVGARSEAFYVSRRREIERGGLRLDATARMLASALDPARLDRLASPLPARAADRLAAANRGLRHAAALVDARDWQRRGYALVRGPDGSLRTTAAGLAPGDRIAVELRDGTVEAIVDTAEGR
jgi:exodeoxyribonuclease VII large subunit